MTYRLLLGPVLAALAVLSCKDSGTGGTGELPKPNHGPAEAPADPQPAEAPQAPTAEELAAQRVVPVALDVGVSKHRLATGIVIRPKHPAAGGKTFVAYLVHADTRVRTTYAWLEDDQKWIRLDSAPSSIEGLRLASFREEPKKPAFDLSMTRKVPAKLSSLLVATWDKELDVAPPKPEVTIDEEERRALTRELQEAYTTLQAEMNELRRGIPPNERPRDRRAAMELERERSTRSMEISREMSALRTEAAGKGIRLSSRGGSVSTRRPSLGIPPRSARLVKTDLEATLDQAGEERPGPYLTMQGEELPAGGVLPGALLALQEEARLRVLALENLATLCNPGVNAVSGYFTISSPARASLTVQAELEPSAFPYTTIQLGVAPKGQLPEDLSQAPHYQEESSGTSGVTLKGTLTLSGEQLKTGTVLEGAIGVRTSVTKNWVRQKPFFFTLHPRTDGTLLPDLVNSDVITWKGPELDQRGVTSPVPKAILSRTLEAKGALRSFQAGGGHTLVVQFADPNRLKLLDVRTGQWTTELPLPAEVEGLPCAADAERLFVFNPADRTLVSYSLSELKEVAKLVLADGPLPLRIAAGYNSRRQPLALLYDQQVELRDPVTLHRIDLPVQSNRSNDSRNSGLGVLRWTFLGSPAQHWLAASSRGDQFSLEVSYEIEGETRPQKKSLTLNMGRADWTSREAWGLPGNEGLLYSDRYAQPGPGGSGRSLSLKTKLSHSLMFLLPATGPGHVAITRLFSSQTLPGSPLGVHFVNSFTAPVPSLTSQAASPGAEALSRDGNHSFALAERLFVHPDLGKIVTLGTERIVIEQFAVPEGETLPTLAGPVPAAFRGQPWRYAVADAKGRAVPLKLAKGPAGATVEADGSLLWNVPANLAANDAVFEIEVGDPPRTQNIATSVFGIPAANLRSPGADPASALPARATFPFAEPIDKVIPSQSARFVAVVSGGSRRVTLLDLEKLQIQGSYDCSTGPAAFALGDRSLYVWHVTGNLLETRSLPDLQPGSIRAVNTSEPLLAFVVGSAPNSLPPLALFMNESHRVVARTVDPESFELGSPVLLPNTFGFSIPDSRFLHSPVLLPPASGTGASFFMSGQFATRQPSGEITATRNPAYSSSSPAHYTMDGSLFLSGNTALNTATGRSWSVNLGGGQASSRSTNILWPDLGLAHVVAVSQHRDQNRNQNFRLHILDADSQEVLHEIDQLFEWDGNNGALFHDEFASSRLVYSSPFGVLLTVSTDRTRVIARKLPIAADE